MKKLFFIVAALLGLSGCVPKPLLQWKYDLKEIPTKDGSKVYQFTTYFGDKRPFYQRQREFLIEQFGKSVCPDGFKELDRETDNKLFLTLSLESYGPSLSVKQKGDIVTIKCL